MGGWRPALRIARRDARRSRGRSVLIVAMVALPVFGMTAIDVVLRTGQLDPDEHVTLTLGDTQARLERLDAGRVQQAPDPEAGLSASGARGEASARPLRDLAPPGLRVLVERSGMVQTRTRRGVGTVSWAEVAAGDPAFRGRFVVREGRAARTRDEVAVSPKLRERLGVSIGETVQLTRPPRRLRVTGVVAEPLAGPLQGYYAVPGALGADDERLFVERAYLAGSRPVTWRDVLALNEHGVVAYSRQVILSPPPRHAVPLYRMQGEGVEQEQPEPLFYIGVALVLALAMLEVLLLAGAAFAVGARRQGRTLALVASSGGEVHHLRWIVLGGGLLLGGAGALVGVVLGVATALLALPLIGVLTDGVMGPLDVRPLDIAGIALFGTATGLLAAVLPARRAARQDPVPALTGRRGSPPSPRRAPILGLLLAAAGVVASVAGSGLALASSSGGRTSLAAALIAGGAVATQIGLIACSSAIIGACGRLAKRLPLAPRLAMRDAARHRGRSAPAMAAVLTAVAASTALAIFLSSVDDQDRRAYTPAWPERTAGVMLTSYEFRGPSEPPRTVQLDPDLLLRRVSPQLPPHQPTVVDVTADKPCDDVCRIVEVGALGSTDDPSGNWGGTPVGGPDVLRTVTGATSADATATLSRGGVVVTDRSYLSGDRLRARVISVAEQRRAMARGGTPRGRAVPLPATYLAAPGSTTSVVYSEAAARKLGFDVVPGTLALRFTGRLPTGDEEDAANAALADAGVEATVMVERGYTSDFGIGLLALALGSAIITLGAAGIATGLAQADAREDHATLAAIGAPPHVRKTLAAAQALSIAVLGTVLGVLAGFVPAMALIGAEDSLHLIVPFAPLAAGILGVPMLAGAAGWLLTRARLPLRARDA